MIKTERRGLSVWLENRRDLGCLTVRISGTAEEDGKTKNLDLNMKLRQDPGDFEFLKDALIRLGCEVRDDVVLVAVAGESHVEGV